MPDDDGARTGADQARTGAGQARTGAGGECNGGERDADDPTEAFAQVVDHERP